MKKSVKKFGGYATDGEQDYSPICSRGCRNGNGADRECCCCHYRNVVPMQIPAQGTEIRVMFNRLPPQPQAYQVEQPSRLILDFDKAAQVKTNIYSSSTSQKQLS